MNKENYKVVVTIMTTALLISGSVSAQENASANPEFNFKNIEVSRDESVLLLRINKPPRNEVSKTTLGEINAGLDMAARDESIGAVVITGTDTVFSAGAGGDSLEERPAGDIATSKGESWEMFDAGAACQTFCLSLISRKMRLLQSLSPMDMK